MSPYAWARWVMIVVVECAAIFVGAPIWAAFLGSMILGFVAFPPPARKERE